MSTTCFGARVLKSFVLDLIIHPRHKVFIKGLHKGYPLFGRTTLKMSNNGSMEAKRSRTDAMRPTIGTHSGTFHCDEVLACFMLRQLEEYANAAVLRSRNNEELRANCEIIVDVGCEFNHERKLYDHHQSSFKETLSSLRPELGAGYNIRLSSAGLIYSFYGERVIDNILRKHANITLSADNLKLVFEQIYRNFICEIDGIDNGVPICPDGSEPVYKISTHLSARIHKLNPSWEEDNDSCNLDDRFEQAMDMAGKELIETVVNTGGSWLRAREYVRQALVDAKKVHESGEILLLERFCPWKSHLADLEKEYGVEGIPKLIIFSENPNRWRVAGVPLTPSSFLGRKFLPKPWCGLRDEELSAKTGIEGCQFVHNTGFIGGASSKEAALAMAVKSVQWSED